MKKLSEISIDTLICVGDAETGLMTKEDFLSDMDTLGKSELYEADPLLVKFDWGDVSEWYSDEQHEDWEEDVHYDIRQCPELIRAAEIMNEIFSRNITYYEGDPIENDMLGSGEEATHGT